MSFAHSNAHTPHKTVAPTANVLVLSVPIDWSKKLFHSHYNAHKPPKKKSTDFRARQ